MSEKMFGAQGTPEEVEKAEENNLTEKQKDQSNIRSVEQVNLTEEQRVQSKEREGIFNAGVEQGEFEKVKDKKISEWTKEEIDNFVVDYILSKYNGLELYNQLKPHFTNERKRFANIKSMGTGYYTTIEIKGMLGEFEINFRKENTTYTDGFSPRPEPSDKTRYGQPVLFINGIKINAQDTKKFQGAISDWGGNPYTNEWPLNGDL